MCLRDKYWRKLYFIVIKYDFINLIFVFEFLVVFSDIYFCKFLGYFVCFLRKIVFESNGKIKRIKLKENKSILKLYFLILLFYNIWDKIKNGYLS